MLASDRAASPTRAGGAHSTVNDLTAIGEGRGTVLGLKLDRMADSVTGQTVVDPKVRCGEVAPGRARLGCR